MLIGFLLLTAVLMALTVRLKGPGWAFSIPWVISVAPMTFGIITYSFLYDDNAALTVFLSIASLSYFAGLGLATLLRRRPAPISEPVFEVKVREEYYNHLSTVKVLWIIGLIGVALQAVDFFVSGLASASSLAELRENVTYKEGASIFGKASQLLVWANIYCFIFALAYRPIMGPRIFAWLASSGLLFVVPGLMSAGRQAAFQIVLVILLTILVPRVKQSRKQKRQGRLVLTGMAVSMAAYMGYIVSARSDLVGGRTKEDVLRAYLPFDLHPWFDSALDFFGPGIRSIFIEIIVYFTHAIGLLDRFMYIDSAERFGGALSFPFIYRQLGEPLLGGSVEAAYQYKVQMLDTAGLMGVGWSTAYSGMYLDFGYFGLIVMMALLGYFTTTSWYAMKQSFRFVDYALCIIMLVIITYLPTAFGLSDTNLLMFVTFCWGIKLMQRERTSRRARLALRRAG